ncbi:nitronate monooxygenase [Halomonas denitrificans]|uniref:NAD(P)H-dependent flavin oxidoreductase n=1 Tax=Halomonas TaxID=2745 RepID=UPI001A8E88A8|nr:MULTISPECIES: nitronate monooxygenase [Halomonas]MED5294835.1 nitronate monooxygenase [Pseudomonadota bacterium]MBN8412554.1 nitronate monooxygenase [Halomonas litopenaei]MBY5924842.1 nitronate monooxygenase [Halomonas sp. DP4Y7-2]MBY5968792.1 nitronate monooxygenase [Halomonas denitrificans]MBY5983831.1 nitronate monooxygenase [Halomonas sp. DP5Y7-2]
MTSLARLRLKRPIFQAPMAGAQDETLAIAVTAAGGLGGLPAGMLSPEALEHALAAIEGHGPVNVNFFCHTTPEAQPERLERWRERLEPYHQELGIAPPPPSDSPTRRPFDEASCAIVEKHKPAVVSFHFGLPSAELVERVKRCGALVMSSATTLDEARWLEANGADVIIAQGTEAGGHRGHFLSDDLSLQQPLAKLLPSIVEAVAVPVVAAGGIADPQGVRWALDQGAAAVQIGTALLCCPEAAVRAVHRKALLDPASTTEITNVFSGRPARGIVNRAMRELGPISREVPDFPLAASALCELRAAHESRCSGDFSPLWAGENRQHCREIPVAEQLEWLAGGLAD